MDPVTHALIGIAVANLQDSAPSLTNPVYLGTVIGAVAPDLDFIMQTRGSLAYLKHHRGISHSLPGICTISAGLAGILHWVFPQVAFLQIFVWTLI